MILHRTVVGHYVECGHHHQWRYHRVLHSVLGVKWGWRDHRGNLHKTWEAMVTWKSELPLVSRTPMPPKLLKAYTVAALLMGFVYGTPRAGMWISGAVLMQAGFRALLRP